MLDKPVSRRHRTPPEAGIKHTTSPVGAGRPRKARTMRRKRFATTAAAVGAAVALAVTAEATASTPPRSETLSFMDASSTSQVFGVIATGAFTDAGTILINGPGKRPGTMRLSHGTIKTKARFTKAPHVDVNPQTCFITERSVGTVELLNGTGAYKGISGSGTFTQSASEIVPTVRGKCALSSGALVGSLQTMTAHLRVSLP
jgi:hypothetical protein